MAARKKTEEPVVRVAPLGELRAYTISEHELEKLEQGAPLSYLLTIGLCLLSAGVAFLIAILSTSLPEFTFVLFFCLLLILGIAGAICTFLGWSLRTNTKELGRQIRARMPDAPTVQQVPPEQGGVSPPATSEPPPTGTTPPKNPTPPSSQPRKP